MSDMVKELKAIRLLLARLVDKLDPQPVKARESGVYVTAVTKRSDGTVIMSGDLAELPSQLEHVTTTTVDGKTRRTTRIKGESR